MKTLQNEKEVLVQSDTQIKKWLIYIGITTAVLVVVSMAGVSAFSKQEVKADTLSLQEQVLLNQAAYDNTGKDAQRALKARCESWKALALSKADLADNVKIAHSIDRASITSVSCDNLTAPTSF